MIFNLKDANASPASTSPAASDGSLGRNERGEAIGKPSDECVSPGSCLFVLFIRDNYVARVGT